MFSIVTLIVVLAPTITFVVAPTDLISLSDLVTLNTLVIVARLCVWLPSNVAVTVYTPATTRSIVSPTAPFIVNVKFSYSTSSTVPLNTASLPIINVILLILTVTFNFSTVNTLVVFTLLCVLFPLNTAVTVYVPAVAFTNPVLISSFIMKYTSSLFNTPATLAVKFNVWPIVTSFSLISIDGVVLSVTLNENVNGVALLKYSSPL